MALRSVGNNITNLLLGIETAIRGTIHTAKRGVVIADAGLCTKGRNLGQLGVSLNLDTPAVILGKMPMVNIHLVLRQEIDLFLDKRDRIDVIPHILHDSAVGITRKILDFSTWNDYIVAIRRSCSTHLNQRLQAIKETCACPAHLHALFANTQHITLGLCGVRLLNKSNTRATAPLFGDHGKLQVIVSL